MPIRENPLIVGHYYHVFNRGVEKRKTFLDNSDYQRWLLSLSYYRFPHPPVKLSTYLETPLIPRSLLKERLTKSSVRLVTVIAYCLMPNHFHLLLLQNEDNGITTYVRRITDSYTKYFNKRYDRVGPLFQGRFKNVLIENDEEFLHVSRYIHLNPYTDHVVSSLGDCNTYKYSSLKTYLDSTKSFIDTKRVLSYFKDDNEKYKRFVEEQGGYQRTLAALKSHHCEL